MKMEAVNMERRNEMNLLFVWHVKQDCGVGHLSGVLQ